MMASMIISRKIRKKTFDVKGIVLFVMFSSGCCFVMSFRVIQLVDPGPEVMKLFSCSTQMSIKYSLLQNMKMPTMVGIFIFISGEIFRLSYI